MREITDEDLERYYEPDIVDYPIKICPHCGRRMKDTLDGVYEYYVCERCGYEQSY